MSFFAMDWLSQIGFFNHFIFNQVIYSTGATGQGKSTQVPKLLLYSFLFLLINLKKTKFSLDRSNGGSGLNEQNQNWLYGW